MTSSQEKHRVVIVGAGFAGFNAARELSRLAGATTEIVVVNSTDYFLYLPLMPQVGGGLVEPRHICISLPQRLGKVRFELGEVNHIDSERKVVAWAAPEGGSGQVTYDRLILTAGSVNKLLPIPGVAEYAHGFRSIAEAFYLRDHITRQLELAAVAADPTERQARCTFVVVGGGYTGTEVAAHGQLMTARLAKKMPGLGEQQIRWLLLDTASRLLAELDQHLSRTAERVLRHRGVEVRTGQSVAEALEDCALLSTGEKVPTRSLIWCVGVRPDPLVSELDLATNRGRLVVDEFLSVPGVSDMYACGDCAAVPDLSRPGQICGMTAQHAQRQGKQVAKNVAASLGIGNAAPYKHQDLGFLVDLGGLAGAANPLHIPLSGLPANALTRAYHLSVMAGNRPRVLADWVLNVISPPSAKSFGLVSSESVPLDVDRPRPDGTRRPGQSASAGQVLGRRRLIMFKGDVPDDLALRFLYRRVEGARNDGLGSLARARILGGALDARWSWAVGSGGTNGTAGSVPQQDAWVIPRWLRDGATYGKEPTVSTKSLSHRGVIHLGSGCIEGLDRGGGAAARGARRGCREDRL